MKFVLPSLSVAALLLAGCASTEDPWMSFERKAATAVPGVRTLISSHYAIDEVCAPLPLPAIALPGEATLGTVTVEETVVSVPESGSDCDGTSVTAVGIFYEAPAGASGYDTFSYIEQIEGPVPDRTHTVEVQVR
jgi:hypothetical protein